MSLGSNKVLSNDCSPELLSRIIDAPSDDLYSVRYKAALAFEKHKFSVTLNENGTLKNVNSESTPASPKELLEIAKGAVGILTGQPGLAGSSVKIKTKEKAAEDGDEKAPLCNQDPKMIFRRCSIKDNDNDNGEVKVSCQEQAWEDFRNWNAIRKSF